MNHSNIKYLQQALLLAESRRGFCAPNPCVGAVLVKQGKIVATGLHWACGSAHAEADALNKVDVGMSAGATLYVTLQPCCHTAKKTPPCTQLLIQKKIAKVLYAFKDPNPAVGEYTDRQLQQAGILCVQQSVAEIDNFYESYQYWWKEKKPFVTAKLAMSLDGKIAGANGKRLQLTGKTAQRFTHRQRQRADAILSTAKTICNDNPFFNVRINPIPISKPLYILDSELRTPLSAHIFKTAKRITLFHKTDVNEQKHANYYAQANVQCVAISSTHTGLNLEEILKYIGRDGHHDLWIEAGGHCFQSFTKNRLLQRAFVYVAPCWLGETAQNAFTEDVFAGSSCLASACVLGSDSCFIFDWTHKKGYNIDQDILG